MTNCSFWLANSPCSSSGSGSTICTLISCKREISSDLLSFAGSGSRRGDLCLSEFELILNRSDPTDATQEQINSLTICPKHRHKLTTDWPGRKSKICRYPLHFQTRKRKKTTNSSVRRVNAATSKEIKEMHKISVPIGSAICADCRNDHYKRRKVVTQSCSVETPQDANTDSTVDVSVVPGPSSMSENKDDVVQDASVGNPVDASETLDPLTNDNDDTMTVSSQSSQSNGPAEISIWDDEKETQKQQRDSLNDTLESISGGRISPIRSTLNTLWSDISTTQQKYYSRKAAELIKTSFSVIAPGQEKELWENIKEDQIFDEENETSRPKRFDPVMVDSFVKAYEMAESWQTRQQILSIFANDFSKIDLQKLIPGLSKWRIDRARQHATTAGRGQPTSEPTIFRARIDPVKVEHFIDFLSQPTMVQDVAYGTKSLKLDTGEQIIIPSVIRTLIPSRIIEQYKSYCGEQGLETASERTLYRIIEVCSASMQKSLQGLDNFSADGGEGFDNILLLLDTLQENGVDESWVYEKTQVLKDGKRYLKADFKAHLGKNEQNPDHCTVHALNDPTAEEYKKQCNHTHNGECDRCISLKEALKEIALKCDDNEMTAEQKERMKYDFKQRYDSIIAWKCHLLRTVNQEEAKQDVLKKLDEHSCLIVMDWAMKFLPQRFRERMSDFFGKRGRSWHVSAIITKSKEDRYEVECLVHIFNTCTQDNFAIMSIVEHVLQTIKQESPITKVYLRSDNAGCYHCGPLLLSLPYISERTGVEIVRYDFSDPQAGKDICDRKIAPMKAHIRRFINEKHDVVTAQDMKQALESHGGVKGCRVAVAEIETSLEAGKDNKIPGISLLNNFSFEKSGIRTWRAYGIGKGRLLSYKNLNMIKQGPTGLKVIEPFGPHKNELGHVTVSNDKSTTDAIFPCSECSCVLTFRTFEQANEHMDTGEHVRKVERESLYDTVRKKWAENITSVSQAGNRFNRDEEMCNDNAAGRSLNEKDTLGWALKCSKKSSKMPENVKAFMVEKFNAGVRSGKKADPAEVSREMKFVKDDNGMPLFKSDEWRTAKQIKNFFSKHAAKQRKVNSNRYPLAQISEDVDDIEACEAETEHSSLCTSVFQALDKHIHPILVGNRNICEDFKQKKLAKMKLTELASVCKELQLDVQGNPRRKQTYTMALEEYIKACTCQLEVHT